MQSMPRTGAPSDPAYLAELLKNAGYEPVMLSASDLEDASKLDVSKIPVVVLPYGPVFPAPAVKNWQRYLHEGGNFFSTGGYAFDEAVWPENGKWKTLAELIAQDPRDLINGRFEGSEGRTVDGDKQAVSFGPDPNRNGELGLVMGYPWETTYKTGGKETSATVKQTFAAPPVGRYQITFMHYSRWTKGAVASQGYDLAMVRFGPHTEGLAGFSVRLTTRDSAGKAIETNDVYSVGAWEEVPYSSQYKQFDITPETASVEVSISMDRLAGSVGISDMQICRCPEEATINTRGATDGVPFVGHPISAFSPTFILRHADRAVADSLQLVIPESVTLKGPFEGMVAEAMVVGNTRFEPVMQALDRYGRPRGALGAIVYHGRALLQ